MTRVGPRRVRKLFLDTVRAPPRRVTPNLHLMLLRERVVEAFYVGLDDAPARPDFVEPDNGEWVWNRGWNRILVDEAGLHTLRIYRRERLVEVDKIVITPARRYQPSGEGPTESPRGSP